MQTSTEEGSILCYHSGKQMWN